jgi:hypothetical protein
MAERDQFPYDSTFACPGPWQVRYARMDISDRTASQDTALPDENQSRSMVVEFAPLSDDQRAFVDLHTLRALGTVSPAVDTDGELIQFWLRHGDTADTAYDDIRGWAIGHRLPIRHMVED